MAAKNNGLARNTSTCKEALTRATDRSLPFLYKRSEPASAAHRNEYEKWRLCLLRVYAPRKLVGLVKKKIIISIDKARPLRKLSLYKRVAVRVKQLSCWRRVCEEMSWQRANGDIAATHIKRAVACRRAAAKAVKEIAIIFLQNARLKYLVGAGVSRRVLTMKCCRRH